MDTIGSSEFNNRRLLVFQLSFSFFFQSLSKRESNTSWSWISESILKLITFRKIKKVFFYFNYLRFFFLLGFKELSFAFSVENVRWTLLVFTCENFNSFIQKEKEKKDFITSGISFPACKLIKKCEHRYWIIRESSWHFLRLTIFRRIWANKKKSNSFSLCLSIVILNMIQNITKIA